MKYIFFGTPLFADIILQKLIEADLAPSFVITNPDKPQGRKKIMTAPLVKQRVMNCEPRIRDRIKIIQPEKLTSSLFATQDYNFDFFVVAAYGKIIPKSILKIPRLGTINVHPSLLPYYRGPTPIQTTILNGDEKTGVTLILLDEEVDHGPILAKRELTMADDYDYNRLCLKLAEMGAELLIETLPKFLKGEIEPKPQEHSKATFTKKFASEDAFIKNEELIAAINGNGRLAIQIERKIRALNPEPGIWTILEKPGLPNLPIGKRVKLLKSEVRGEKLTLKQIQVEGKKAMAT